MVNRIGRTHKLVKNKQRPGVTNNNFNAKLTTLHHYDKYIKRIILAIEQSRTTETYLIPEEDAKDA